MSDIPKKRFILDTNMLIGFSFWIPINLNNFFWTKFSEYLKNAEWILLDTVVNEITHKGNLQNWCKEQKRIGTVCILGDEHRSRGVEINNAYKMIDETTLRSTVDTYIIAYAEANKLTVLSREANRETQNDLYKIPDVCTALKIDYVRNPEPFLQAMGFKN